MPARPTYKTSIFFDLSASGVDPQTIPARIFALRISVLAAMKGVPAINLDNYPEERAKLGGHLFEGDSRFVSAVATALRVQRDLFPDIPTSGEQLQGRQDRANAWRGLASMFATLARIASDGYLYEQGTAVREALDVMKQVSSDEERPFGVDWDQHVQRLYALILAQHYLDESAPRKTRREQLKRLRKEKKRAERQAALAAGAPLRQRKRKERNIGREIISQIQTERLQAKQQVAVLAVEEPAAEPVAVAGAAEPVSAEAEVPAAPPAKCKSGA